MEDGLSPDLNLFEGMDGFEKFDPLDDSSLMAILDDLEEGTLLSLLGDDTLLSDVSGEMSTSTTMKVDTEFPVFPVSDMMNESREQPHCDFVNTSPLLSTASQPSDTVFNSVPETLGPISVPLSSSVVKRPLQEPLQVNTLKRARLDSSNTEHLLSCVKHDHSYAAAAPLCDGDGVEGTVCKEPRTPVGSSSDEEGSLSDAGYDTMSSSTSPGNSSGGSPASSAGPQSDPVASVLPQTSKVDPVALIDARIQHFMCSREVNLTEEEKETLKAEGLPIPTTLPLTKAEEKALRGVRRRIRNKVAAQESRKRKKEHLTLLEDKCQQYSSENHQLKRTVEALETENKSLRTEVNKLKELLATHGVNSSKTTRVGACLMVMVLCFAIFFGSITPHSLWPKPSDYSTSSVRSRSLLSMEDSTTFRTQASNWFREIFMLEKFTDEDPIASLYHSHEEPPMLYGPLSYYEHVVTQFSGYLNFTVSQQACSISEPQTENFNISAVK